jgi:hypothetical protein
MTVMLLAAEDTGGIPVIEGGAAGGLVTEPGHLQYGDMLLGNGTPAGWRELVGWRDTPEASVSDSPRPQAHGAYPGDVWGDALTVTFTYVLRGTPGAKASALNAIERYAPMDGVERALVVNDGDGAWLRWARVIARQVPQDYHFSHAPLECSIQFLCADPRRYALTEQTRSTSLPVSSGGLVYPLDYPTDYGTSTSGAASARNNGSVATPLTVTFVGPLVDPILTASDWTLGFNITLVDGETLVVDTSMGTALLNGTADRLYLIRNDTDPLERALLRPGVTNLSLIASSGTGRAEVTYRDARM